MPTIRFTFLVCFSVVAAAAIPATAQDETEASVSPLNESGNLVNFQSDIVPILQAHCLECHGPNEAKNDFRVDDRDSVMDYLAESADDSDLYATYLTTDDPDMLMPPTSHGGPLSAGELALIRVWINEGASWPDDAKVSDAPPAVAVADESVEPRTLPQRVWAAMGFLHPATVHFPIALFLLGGGFVVLGWKWPSIGFQIPLACLLLGTLTAIASTVMGWSFAPEQGYGAGWNLLDWDREIDTHRWSGVFVTLFSTIVSVIALVALWKDSESLTKYWKIGLLVCAGMVGAVGHQGGELSYGADFYPRALRILTGTENQQADVDIEATEAAAPSE